MGSSTSECRAAFSPELASVALVVLANRSHETDVGLVRQMRGKRDYIPCRTHNTNETAFENSRIVHNAIGVCFYNHAGIPASRQFGFYICYIQLP